MDGQRAATFNAETAHRRALREREEVPGRTDGLGTAPKWGQRFTEIRRPVASRTSRHALVVAFLLPAKHSAGTLAHVPQQRLPDLTGLLNFLRQGRDRRRLGHVLDLLIRCGHL